MIKFPPVIVPVASNVPITLTPIVLATIIFELPATDIATSAYGVIIILLVPYVKVPAEIVLSDPRKIVVFAKYKSFHLFVALPKS